ncbi:uncharacterized protein LOC115256701 [Aedes albopictus]|uniref:DUF7083 domain-containing protein n=1 Tax=Aedes albopictus TaxID=7160 RepID=A0ABM1Y3D4_AEDAL
MSREGTPSWGANEGETISFQQALTQILTQQQRLITQLSQQMSATQLGLKELSRDDVALNALANNINEFRYAPEEVCTFDSWYARYSELFDQDAKKLDDSAKVRLLMRKLNPAAHERYTSFILPKQSNEFTFSETVEKLKSLFGSPVSIFHRRYQCLQTVKDDTEDIVAYSCKVNRACVDFKLADLSEEQFKSLIFVCGLKSSKDSDIQMRLITKLNESSEITLTKIVEDCRSLMNLKSDNVLVEKQSPSSVHAVKYNNKKTSKPKHQPSAAGSSSGADQPRSPCWSCGGMHFSKDCQFREHTCRDCGKKGHKEGYCACFAGRSTAGKGKKPARNQKSTKVVSVNSVSRGRKYAEVRINNVPVRLQIDSASDISIITDAMWKQIGKPEPSPPSCQAVTASGEPLNIASELWCDVTINGVSKRGLCRVMVPEINLSVLGSDWMDKFGLWDVPINSFCNQVSSRTPSDVASLQAKFP